MTGSCKTGFGLYNVHCLGRSWTRGVTREQESLYAPWALISESMVTWKPQEAERGVKKQSWREYRGGGKRRRVR